MEDSLHLLARERLIPFQTEQPHAAQGHDAIASTMAAVYPSVFLVDVPEFSNTLVYGTTEPVTLADVEHNLGLVSEPFARDVAQSVLSDGRLRLSPYHGQVFTDDLAPVERLIDEIIFGYVTGR